MSMRRVHRSALGRIGHRGSISLLTAGLGLLLSTRPLGADIKNWQTGQTIPGTEGITPGPNMDLSDWNRYDHHLEYANFSGGLDLSGSRFAGSWVSWANFTGANLTQADFTQANLTQANLAGASLWGATLTGANLTNAVVANARFEDTTSGGFTKEQLYSTASYKAKDLHGIGLAYTDLSGWNFAGQNLTRAKFWRAMFISTDLSLADLRGAQDADLAGALTRNTIRPDGSIPDLNLAAGEILTAYECDGNIPLRLSSSFKIDPHAQLDLRNNALIVSAEASNREALLAKVTALLASGRNSTPTLWLGPGLMSTTASQTPGHGLGVLLEGNEIRVQYTWTGDANLDGTVDAADYFLIDSGFIAQRSGYRNGDFNYDGTVDAADYFLVDSAFLAQNKNPDAAAVPSSPVPEPSTLSLFALGILAARRRCRA